MNGDGNKEISIWFNYVCYLAMYNCLPGNHCHLGVDKRTSHCALHHIPCDDKLF